MIFTVVGIVLLDHFSFAHRFTYCSGKMKVQMTHGSVSRGKERIKRSSFLLGVSGRKGWGVPIDSRYQGLGSFVFPTIGQMARDAYTSAII